jgi:hypothetical protein
MIFNMTVNFWKPGSAGERQQKWIDYAIVWLMVALTVAGVAPRLIASHLIVSHLIVSWGVLISAR